MELERGNFINLLIIIFNTPELCYYGVYYKQMSSIYNYRRGLAINYHSWQIETPI